MPQETLVRVQPSHFKRNKMNEIIYIASPYSHTDPAVVQSNFETVSKYCAQCVKNGEVLISPITYGHTLLTFEEMPSSWEFWTNFCLSILVKCDRIRVVKMDGWDKSAGVEGELSCARDHGIPIEYVEHINGNFYKTVNY